MKKPMILAVLACSLAACGNGGGVGFTGLSSEPASVSREQRTSLTGGSSYASLSGPVVETNRNPRNVNKQVRQALAAPAENPLQVRLAGDTVRMNLVEVRGQRYAVLRPVDGAPLSNAATKSFAAYARSLTGCAQTGPYYSDKNAPGAATALACG